MFYKNAVVLFLSSPIWMVYSIFTPVVEIEQGKLRGLRSVAGQNRYYGIPYAVSKRFQLPQEPPPWEGVLNAMNIFGSCAQTFSELTLGTEDCHHLDVYTPEVVQEGDRLPVLVFIHGGAYYYGTKAHYNPEFLVVKKVVSVILNYRVGVLGFLCLNGIANLGLKDQVAALKWIKKNIAAFGGDPDNVTISGQSAGASAAGMHLLSDMSKGLFHKALLMSGSPLAPWAFNVEPLRPAFEDAKKLGIIQTEKDVYNVFANASIRDLLAATKDVSVNTRYFKYSPCIDSNFRDPFFKDRPFNIIKSEHFNKVPIMIGFVDVEGMLFYGINSEKTFKELNENFVDRLPSVFSWCSPKDKNQIADQIRKHYFGDKTIDKTAVKEIVHYYSDWLAYSTVNAFNNIVANVSNQPIYSYIFSYEGERNFAKSIFGSSTRLEGSSHSDDIFYVFKPAGLSMVLTTQDQQFIDKFTIMITNFMKFGDPTPKTTKLLPIRWPPITPGLSKSLVLSHRFAVKETPDKFKGKFFLKVLCKYGLNGFVPCQSAQQCNIN